MNYKWKKYKLTLRNPFVLSYGSFTHRYAYIIILAEADNEGYGEATAITYYNWTEQVLEHQFDRIAEDLAIGVKIEALFDSSEFAPPVRHALHSAWMDLLAKRENKTLGAYLGIVGDASVPTSSVTISGQDIKALGEQVKNYDWSTYKIKMGTAADDKILDFICAHPDKKFRIDANAGWTSDWMIANAYRLNAEHIELIEQPFPVGNEIHIVKVKNYIFKPFFADESCQDESEIEKCSFYFDGINIKLMKCGGIDKGLQMISNCKIKGIRTMLGCMTETSVGISHAAQLAHLVDMIDLDGSFLLANDPAEGVRLDRGQLIFREAAGSGIRLKTE